MLPLKGGKEPMQDATFHFKKGNIHHVEMETGFTHVSKSLKYKAEVQIY